MPSPPDGPRHAAIRLIRQWIDDGLLPVGSPLPGERTLAKRLGLPQATVHRALAELATAGVIGPVRNRTRLVRDPASSGRRDGAIVILAPLRRAHSVGIGFADHVNGGAHARIAELGLRALACAPGQLDDAAVGRLLASWPLGVVYPDPVHSPPAVPGLVARLVAAGTHCVVADDGPEFAGCDRVLSDHDAGSAMLVRWLLRRGRRRIVQVWSGDYEQRWWYRPRRAGYERVLREAGCEPLPPLEVPSHPLDTSEVSDHMTLQRSLAYRSRFRAGWLIEALRGPQAADALMVESDGDAYAVAGAARIIGIPPGGLDIVGYDGYAAVSPFATIGEAPLASIDKRNPEVGAALVDLLMERVAGRLPPEPQTRLVEPRLLENPALVT